MKKFFFFVMVCACVCLTSCNKFESQVVKISDDFETFTDLNIETGDTVVGVRQIADQKVIIAAEAYNKITFDGCIFKAEGAVGLRQYDKNGKPLNAKSNLLPTSDGEKFCYTGMAGIGQIEFYFPNNGGEELTAQACHQGNHTMALVTDKGFSIRDFNGVESALFEAENLIWAKKDGNEELFYVIIPGDRNTAEVFDTTGKSVKKLNKNQWRQLQRKLDGNVEIAPGKTFCFLPERNGLGL